MRIPGAGVDLEVDVQGEPDRPAVLLLHGFPDTHSLWRHQLPALHDAGFRTVAPDLRGRGESERPAEVSAYGLRHSVADMLAVLDHLQLDRVHLVGHDFGAPVAWLLTAFAPQRVNRLAALSVGHPMTSRALTLEQREKQWYTLLFQFEGVAEELLARDDWALWREWTRGEGDPQLWLADLSRPGALTAGLNWYRANMHPRRQLRDGPDIPPVEVPTLGLWSDGDHYLTEDGMVRSADYVRGPWRYERIEGASHWLQLDQPEVVNRLLVEHFTG